MEGVPGGGLGNEVTAAIVSFCTVVIGVIVAIAKWRSKKPDEANDDDESDVRPWRELLRELRLRIRTLEGQTEQQRDDIEYLKQENIRCHAEQRRLRNLLLERGVIPE